MIDINKQYRTRDGLPVRILAADVKSRFPVIYAVKINEREFIYSCTTEGKYYAGSESTTPRDLIEYNPAQDLVLDQPLWVKDTINNEWNKRHFAKFENNKVYCWGGGTTSHTQEGGDIISWKHFSTTDPSSEATLLVGTEPNLAGT